ncbi:MAG: ankyrin repeat domain-containing protein [Rivularia sp. (in: cyanobacteria)]
MNANQPIPLLYSGQGGDYFGTEYEKLPKNVHPSILEVGQLLTNQGMIYVGKLICSQFHQVEIYAYVSPEKHFAVSAIAQESNLQGIDCVSRFADNSYLTTTTVKVIQNAYEEQGLFRVSLPALNVVELIKQHLDYVKDFEKRCGEVQAMFDDLLAIAQMVDEYTIRQQSNPGHGLLQFTSGLASVGMSQVIENDLDNDENIPLSEQLGDAAMYGKLAKVEQLIAEGADVNAIAECGKTPLMLAAMYGHKNVIEKLLDAGADPNLGGEEEFEEGTTALMCIASSLFASNRAEVIKFLVNRGADVNARNDNGETALIVACNNADSVKALIEAGADVNLPDNEGNTAMMLSDWAVQQLLRQAGASE